MKSVQFSMNSMIHVNFLNMLLISLKQGRNILALKPLQIQTLLSKMGEERQKHTGTQSFQKIWETKFEEVIKFEGYRKDSRALFCSKLSKRSKSFTKFNIPLTKFEKYSRKHEQITYKAIAHKPIQKPVTVSAAGENFSGCWKH